MEAAARKEVDEQTARMRGKEALQGRGGDAGVEEIEVDVVIVGAGPAGIAAARQLLAETSTTTTSASARPPRVMLVEARDRVGGRTWTSTKLGVPVDLGASWIHHYSAANPLAFHVQHANVQEAYEVYLRSPAVSLGADPTTIREAGGVITSGAPSTSSSSSSSSSTSSSSTSSSSVVVVPATTSDDADKASYLTPPPPPHHHPPSSSTPTPRLPTAIFCGYVDAVNASGDPVPIHAPARGLGNGHGKFILFDANGERVPLPTYQSAVEAYNQAMDASEHVADELVARAPPQLPDGWHCFRSYAAADLAELFAQHRAFSHAHDQHVLGVLQPLLPSSCASSPISQPYRSRTSGQHVEHDSTTSPSPFVSTMGFLLSGGEQYEAARLESMSAMYWQSGSSGSEQVECDMFVNYGYGALVAKLAADLPVRLGHVVERIEYGNGDREDVRIVASTSQVGGSSSGGADRRRRCVFRTKQCIVTAPLGVLKQKSIEFVPALPTAKQQAIDDMGTGIMNKIVLQFDDAFWGDDVISIGHGDRERGVFRWFLSLKPALTKSASFAHANTNVLVCFVTCEHAKELEALSDAEQVGAAMRVLRRAFGAGGGASAAATAATAATATVANAASSPLELPPKHDTDTVLGTEDDFLWTGPLSRPLPLAHVPDPVNYEVTRWWSDPYSRGSYSHYRVGASPLTVLMLGAHVGGGPHGRVGFAGEHTCLSSIGCVDSAWETGVREGHRVAQAWLAEQRRE